MGSIFFTEKIAEFYLFLSYQWHYLLRIQWHQLTVMDIKLTNQRVNNNMLILDLPVNTNLISLADGFKYR